MRSRRRRPLDAQHVANKLDAIREARRELDAVIEEIQAIPGFEGSSPLLPSRRASAADERPIVYISPAEPGAGTHRPRPSCGARRVG